MLGRVKDEFDSEGVLVGEIWFFDDPLSRREAEFLGAFSNGEMLRVGAKWDDFEIRGEVFCLLVKL